jgi:hypothetical protein
MRQQDAHTYAAQLEQVAPTARVIMLLNGVAMLREAGIPLPAWAVPSASWMILVRDPVTRMAGVIHGHSQQDYDICRLIGEHRLVGKRGLGETMNVRDFIAQLRQAQRAE